MIRAIVPVLSLAFLLSPWIGFAEEDPYGGAGGHFLVVQELPGSGIADPRRCATHFGPLDPLVEAVREANLVAPVTDVMNGTLDFEAASVSEVVGSISVCYRTTIQDREHEVFAVIELETGEQRLLLEGAGICQEYRVPLNATVLYQSCSLHITGPRADGVRSGTITSGGLIPKAQPTASVKPHTWSIFVVRD